MLSARRPKSRIICGVAWGDMKVEKTPIFMVTLLVSLVSQGRFFATRSAIWATV